jgi:hypothetical protein
MKPVIIIAIAFVLLIPIPIFAETFEVEILEGAMTQGCEITSSCVSPSTITIHKDDKIEFVTDIDNAFQFWITNPKGHNGIMHNNWITGPGTYYFKEQTMPWIKVTVHVVPDTTNQQLGNYLNVEKFEKVGNYIFLKANGHMDIPTGRIDISDNNGASTGSEGYTLNNFIDDDGFFSIDYGWNSCWGGCEHPYYDGIYKISLRYFDEYSEKNTVAQEVSARLNILPEGKTVHEIQILDGSMDNKCNNKCVEPEITHIKRGDSIKIVHNDCEGCHFMRILANEDEVTPGFEYYPFENGKTRWMFEETRAFTDTEHPWIKGTFIVSTETSESKIESKEIICPQGLEPVNGKCPDKSVIETTIEPEPSLSDSNRFTPEHGIAPFVDKSKDPQSYIDRYNNEPTYKKWFDDNYPQYDTIEQAVGLELTQKIPSWVKNIFGWYAADKVTENELLDAIKYLINQKILIVS